MPSINGRATTRRELMRLVGRLDQVAGVRLVTLGDGIERGVRVLEFRTGTGYAFDVLVDRSMDVGRPFRQEFNLAPWPMERHERAECIRKRICFQRITWE